MEPMVRVFPIIKTDNFMIDSSIAGHNFIVSVALKKIRRDWEVTVSIKSDIISVPVEYKQKINRFNGPIVIGLLDRDHQRSQNSLVDIARFIDASDLPSYEVKEVGEVIICTIKPEMDNLLVTCAGRN